MGDIDPSEITPEAVYLSRRRFMLGLGALAAASVLPLACGQPAVSPQTPGTPSPAAADDLTSYDAITNYNNYYEFTLSKEGVASRAKGLKTAPWTVAVGGLVGQPKVYDVDDLRGRFGHVERVYRLRCVEAWSMVVPWLGFRLADLLREVEPRPQARYVRFETLYRPDEMPGQSNSSFAWPYVEGLRLDEAMHDLTLMATGIYGRDLPPQNGAPIRLVVPWKYGFKNIKSVVKIDLVEARPVSFWMASSPGEYGFYANVSPDVSHPRWSQATERRIGESGRRATLPFNGYAEEVASLYAGMDLRKDY